jgi:NADPH-dependent 7-cyano-7-deazaguanine reductase QueF-like protein
MNNAQELKAHLQDRNKARIYAEKKNKHNVLIARMYEEKKKQDKLKTYKVIASQTIYATYEIEVDADNEQQAEEKALNTYINDWDDERFENADALTVDEIEEVKDE